MMLDEVMEIERGFWYEGAEYYEEHISEEAVFVFPGMRLNKQDGVRSADQVPRWEELDLSNEDLIEPADGVVILTYRAKGKREGEEPYEGDVTTVYRWEDNAPKMVFHQHTPVPDERE